MALGLLLVVGIGGACSGPSPLDLSVVAGSWGGSVSQPNSVAEIEYPISVEFEATGDVGDEVARVEYRTLSCSGAWVLEGSDDDSTDVVERVDAPSDECVDEGKVSLSYFEPDDTISYIWDDDPGDDGGRSIAELERK